MDEYIEKRKALLSKVTVTQESEYAKGWNDAIDAIVKNACDLTDLLKVVRCKECKHWRGTDEYGDGYCGNPDGIDNVAHEKDFCSYGERREENAES